MSQAKETERTEVQGDQGQSGVESQVSVLSLVHIFGGVWLSGLPEELYQWLTNLHYDQLI